MTTKQQYIARAQALGSKATTIRGAGRAILAATKPITGHKPYAPRKAETIPAHTGLRLRDEWQAKLRILPPTILRGLYLYTPARPEGDSELLMRSRYIDARATPRAGYLYSRWLPRLAARADRIARQLGIWAMDDASALADTLTAQYCAPIAYDLERSWPLKRSRSGWAGGEHRVSVTIGARPDCSGGSDKVWSDNGKWSGTNSYAKLTATLGALSYFPSLRTPDGSIILDAERIGPREYKVAWLEQSRGFDLRLERGWLIRGYHVKAPGIESARKKAATAREKALSATLRVRDRRRARRAELAPLATRWIAVEDSIAAGNCKAITDQFATRIWSKIGASGPCAVRADIVLSERDDSFVRRALAVAESHHAA